MRCCEVPSTLAELLTSGTDSELGAATGQLGSMPIATSPTQTTAELTEETGALRKRVSLLRQDVEKNHQYSTAVEWRILSNRRSASSVKTLLIELGDLGFAWRDIARLMGVSVAAIQKWRKGEGTTGPNRRKLASLLAACDLISTHYTIDDLASWFEMPILDDIPVTPIDLWLTGNQKLVFEHASSHQDPAVTLNSFDPDWQSKYRSAFDKFRDEDGNLGLHMKDEMKDR